MEKIEYIAGFLFAILVVTLLTCYINYSESGKTETQIIFNNVNTTIPVIKEVKILGAVNKPGIVKISTNPPRLYDAINEAGGLSKNANFNKINYASNITTAKLITIPFYFEDEVRIIHAKKILKQSKKAQKKGSKSKSVKYKYKKNKQVLKPSSININRAGKEQLCLLPGIGEVLSERIIAQRDKKRFTKPEDILKVKGIGKKKLAQMLPYIIF